MGARPLQPSVTVPDAGASAGSAAPSSPAPVPARYGSPSSSSSSDAPGDAATPSAMTSPAIASVSPASASAEVVPLQRLASPGSAPVSAPARPMEIHLPTPGVPGSGRTSIPEPSPVAAMTAPTAPSPSAPALPWTPRQGVTAQPSMALPRPAAAAAIPTVQTSRAPGGSASTANHSSAPAASSSSGGTSVQRAVHIGEIETTVDTTPSTSSAGAGSAQAPQSEADLDRLATAIFGRIRRQLRSEVIHEREARGLTFDVF